MIGHLLAGRSAAAVFPTGGGKSLCYQVPALLLPGLTLALVAVDKAHPGTAFLTGLWMTLPNMERL